MKECRGPSEVDQWKSIYTVRFLHTILWVKTGGHVCREHDCITTLRGWLGRKKHCTEENKAPKVAVSHYMEMYVHRVTNRSLTRHKTVSWRAAGFNVSDHQPGFLLSLYCCPSILSIKRKNILTRHINYILSSEWMLQNICFDLSWIYWYLPVLRTSNMPLCFKLSCLIFKMSENVDHNPKWSRVKKPENIHIYKAGIKQQCRAQDEQLLQLMQQKQGCCWFHSTHSSSYKQWISAPDCSGQRLC